MITHAVITARAGSVRLPGKNMLPVGGVPLALRSVQHAREAGLAPIVTTDIPELLAAAGGLVDAAGGLARPVAAAAPPSLPSAPGHRLVQA